MKNNDGLLMVFKAIVLIACIGVLNVSASIKWDSAADVINSLLLLFYGYTLALIFSFFCGR